MTPEQHMCAMAYELTVAMSTGQRVTVDTTQGTVHGHVCSKTTDVPDVAGGKLAFNIDGRQVHVATVTEVTRHG